MRFWSCLIPRFTDWGVKMGDVTYWQDVAGFIMVVVASLVALMIAVMMFLDWIIPRKKPKPNGGGSTKFKTVTLSAWGTPCEKCERQSVVTVYQGGDAGFSTRHLCWNHYAEVQE